MDRPRAERLALQRVLVLLLGALGSASAADLSPKPGPNSPEEPMAANASLAKAGVFLDSVALDWTRERKCGTCHTNYAQMIARPALPDPDSSAAREVRAFFEGRVARWDEPARGSKPRFDAEVIATASALAMNDAARGGPLSPATRAALDRTWTLQRSDGSFDWLKCNWPPLEHDDYFGAVLAAVAVGHAPDGYAQTPKAMAGLDRLRAYFHAHPAPDLHHATFLLWASLKVDGLMSTESRAELARKLLALQHADGGWSLTSLGHYTRHDGTPNPVDAPSDGYGTGLVVYVLRQADIPGTAPPLSRGLDWLRSHQRTSGRWFTRSPSTDKNHYITHAGTAFAALALASAHLQNGR